MTSTAGSALNSAHLLPLRCPTSALWKQTASLPISFLLSLLLWPVLARWTMIKRAEALPLRCLQSSECGRVYEGGWWGKSRMKSVERRTALRRGPRFCLNFCSLCSPFLEVSKLPNTRTHINIHIPKCKCLSHMSVITQKKIVVLLKKFSLGSVSSLCHNLSSHFNSVGVCEVTVASLESQWGPTHNPDL